MLNSLNHPRDHHVGLGGEQAAELVDIARFVDIVELLAQTFVEFGVDRLGVDFLPHQIAGKRLQRAQQQFQVAEVLVDRRVDARVLNLDRDLRAVLQARAMDLAQRGGGEGLGLEARKELFGRLAQFAPNLLRDQPVIHRRHARLRGLENIEGRAGQQVGARREHLNQFHEGAAQLLGALDDPPRILEMRIEQLLLVASGLQKRTAQGGPEVARADLRSETADLNRAARASAGEGFSLRHRVRSGSDRRG